MLIYQVNHNNEIGLIFESKELIFATTT